MIENIPYMPEGFEPNNDEEETEFVFDDTPDHVYLVAMCDAYVTADMINPMTPSQEERKKRIMGRSLRLIDRIVGDIYKDFISRDD